MGALKPLPQADVTNPISIEGQQLSLARLTIAASSPLASKTVGYVEDNYHLNIILLRHDHSSEMHPTDTRPLDAGDTLGVVSVFLDDAHFVELMRTFIEVPDALRTSIFTPAFGTFTPTFGCTAFQ